MEDDTVKYYDVTGEMKDTFEEYLVAEKCRLDAIDRVWGTKRAIKFGKIAAIAERKFWREVRELYPELEFCKLFYDNITNKLCEKFPVDGLDPQGMNNV